jgi:hypothetical protein
MKIQKLNEFFDTSKENYLTKLEGIDVSFYHTPEEMVHSEKATIEWNISFEGREWGIKSIFIEIKKITLEYIAEDIEGDDDRDVVIELQLDDWKINSEIESTGRIYPNSIDCDFSKKTNRYNILNFLIKSYIIIMSRLRSEIHYFFLDNGFNFDGNIEYTKGDIKIEFDDFYAQFSNIMKVMN